MIEEESHSIASTGTVVTGAFSIARQEENSRISVIYGVRIARPVSWLTT